MCYLGEQLRRHKDTIQNRICTLTSTFTSHIKIVPPGYGVNYTSKCSQSAIQRRLSQQTEPLQEQSHTSSTFPSPQLNTAITNRIADKVPKSATVRGGIPGGGGCGPRGHLPSSKHLPCPPGPDTHPLSRGERPEVGTRASPPRGSRCDSALTWPAPDLQTGRPDG